MASRLFLSPAITLANNRLYVQKPHWSDSDYYTEASPSLRRQQAQEVRNTDETRNGRPVSRFKTPA
jgi:hypothetical protein